MEQEQYFTSVNEDWRGNYSFDQAITLQESGDKTSIFMTRPYSSLYEFERGLATLVTDAHMNHLLERDDFDERELNFEQIYR